MKREEFRDKCETILIKMFKDEDEDGIYPIMAFLDQLADLYDSALPPAGGATDKFRDVLNEVQRYIETNGGATESEMKAIWNSLSCAITESEKRQPTAEGAGEVLEKHLADLRKADIKPPLRYGVIYNRIIDAMREFAAQQQPTAEGAEEILASLVESLGEPDNSVTDHSYQIRPLTVDGKAEWWIVHHGVGSGEPLAQWLSKFATLHSQKIADKMVSERLREE